MVRVLGNSPERIKINDLGDVLYYRQQKDYTDQEFETSKDLRREIQSGRVTIIEKSPSKGMVTESGQDPVFIRQTTPGISSEDIKAAVSQALAGVPRNGDLVKDVVQQLMPLIGETIRQEMGRIPRQGVAQSQEMKPTFIGPEYIPDVNIDDFKSSVKGEERTSSGTGVSSSLEALKRLKRSI